MIHQLPHLLYVQGDTINELVHDAMTANLDTATHVPSRNGGASSNYNVELTLTDPRCRHLSLTGRTSNIFQMIAETFWVCSGSGRVDGFLEYFLPRAKEYSDDGIHWRGAYGPRIFEYGQMEGVIERFKADKMTRQAVVDIYQSEKDSPESIRVEYDLKSTKDLPCNDFIFFWIEPDNSFHMKTVQRSGDLIFGAGSINLFEFPFIHEWVFSLVQKMYPEITLGAYHHNTINLHLYDFTRQQAEDVVGADQYLGEEYYKRARIVEIPGAGFPSTLLRGQKFFKVITNIWEAHLDKKSVADMRSMEDNIHKRMAEFGVQPNTLIGIYCQLITDYIAAKQMHVEGQETVVHHVASREMPDALRQAVIDSKFRKFKFTKKD